MSEENIEAYKNALEHVWKNGIASVDEYAMLDVLRNRLNITPEQHLKMEIEARKKASGEHKIVKEKVFQQTQAKPKPESQIQSKQETQIQTKPETPFQSPQQQFGTESETKVDITQKQQPETQVQQPEQKPQQLEKQYPCPNCRQPLTYISQYKRWYCYSCKKYA